MDAKDRRIAELEAENAALKPENAQLKKRPLQTVSSRLSASEPLCCPTGVSTVMRQYSSVLINAFPVYLRVLILASAGPLPVIWSNGKDWHVERRRTARRAERRLSG